MSERWTRSQRAAVVELGDDVLLVDRTGVVRRIEGDGAALAREVIAFVGQPRSESEIIAHVESLAGPLGARRAVVVELLGLLAETGAVGRAATAENAARAIGANIVVCASGAIAASSLPAFIAALQRRGHTIEVALTETAVRFVGVDALTAIAQREPHVSMWPKQAHAPVPHVALADWADLVIVYPASATTIARLAHGDFSELVAAIAMTTRAPVVIAPSMNSDMLDAAAVQRNLEQLRQDGFAIVGGVPSQEVAEAPSVRTSIAGAAPAPGELAATIDALRTAGVLKRRGGDAPGSRAWESIYRGAGENRALLPWASETCDADLAAALERFAPAKTATGPARLLDVGCGLGQVARHAAAQGYRVVATDIAEAALALARSDARARDVVFVRDDICASALAGPFDVVVDRASLHVLPSTRSAAWGATMRRLVGPGGVLIVKAHREGVAGATTGWSAERLTAQLPGFELLETREAELPGIADATPVPSSLFVLRRA